MATGKARVLPLMFAASYPERTRAVVVNDVAATKRRSLEHPWGMSAEEIDAEVRVVRERWGTRQWPTSSVLASPAGNQPRVDQGERVAQQLRANRSR